MEQQLAAEPAHIGQHGHYSDIVSFAHVAIDLAIMVKLAATACARVAHQDSLHQPKV